MTKCIFSNPVKNPLHVDRGKNICFLADGSTICDGIEGKKTCPFWQKDIRKI